MDLQHVGNWRGIAGFIETKEVASGLKCNDWEKKVGQVQPWLIGLTIWKGAALRPPPFAPRSMF